MEGVPISEDIAGIALSGSCGMVCRLEFLLLEDTERYSARSDRSPGLGYKGTVPQTIPR